VPPGPSLKPPLHYVEYYSCRRDSQFPQLAEFDEFLLLVLGAVTITYINTGEFAQM